ncbi:MULTISPECIES: flagellar hook-associated protein FlgK [unclassified Photobacterium]|uniref:flagellar hook-associated protein FlgK n=1 Tax=unclassified Photobacterium TaxID=2628852 RepID=UPI000D16B00E|nr:MULTISPECIES: flagellar hook-associated protein FlgK [unclassified Photobacterium]PSV33402.1 flagellar hook-associated protein FlgK [Photobacterium sp. GB-72]PSV55365.1 flagellar hook-associated protein FlgK [Photobacterium sp. GB-1]PSW75462.1 flagellar hook-associated protein FlgK [Photobacterium sp. GB-50]
MASDLMQLGISGLRTSQKQLDVTSHNISNVHTAGYSRQVVDQKAADAQWSGGNYYGSGAYIDSVNRAYDQFAARELTLSTTQLEASNVRQQHMMMLDDFTSKSAVNTVNSMNNFYNSVRSLSDHPNDLGSRQTVLEHAEQAARSFNNSYETLTNIRRDVNEQLDVTLERVNALGQELAAINTSLQGMPDGDKNHDLLDKQRGLINELAKYTKVTVLADKGSLADKVIIGSGDTLVSGVESSQLKMVNGDPDLEDKQMALINGNQAKAIKSDHIGGGLGAMLSIRDDVIDKSLDEMGRMAIGFSKQINDLQQSGTDLSGAVGGAIFYDVNNPNLMKERVLKPLGSQTDIDVKIDDVNALKTGEYQLTTEFDGTDYSFRLIDPAGNEMKQSNGNPLISPTATMPLSVSVDGLTLTMNTVMGNPPAAGQSETVIIQPMRRGAANISVEMSDPRGLAGNKISSIEANPNNVGTAELNKAGGLVPDQLAGTYRVDIINSADLTATNNASNTGTATLTAIQAAGATVAQGTYTLSLNGAGDKLSMVDAANNPINLVDATGAVVNELDYPLTTTGNVLTMVASNGDQISVASLTSGAAIGDTFTLAITASDKLTVTNTQTNTLMDLKDDAGNTVQSLAYPLTNVSKEITFAGQTAPTLSLTDNGQVGDNFTVTLGRTNAVGGNSNFLAMQQIQHGKTMNEGKSSVIDLFEGLATDIGMLKNNADKTAEVNQLDFDAASERVSNLSGVNLDEEAANLMKFQQSYMASSRIMSVAKETFDTLMRTV